IQEPALGDFHGNRDYLALVKQSAQMISEQQTDTREEALNSIMLVMERNFGGLRDSTKRIVKIFQEVSQIKQLEVTTPVIRLVHMNLRDSNARYLLLISKGSSGMNILQKYFKDVLGKNTISIVGSNLPEDFIEDEDAYKILKDIALYMEKG